MAINKELVTLKEFAMKHSPDKFKCIQCTWTGSDTPGLTVALSCKITEEISRDFYATFKVCYQLYSLHIRQLKWHECLLLKRQLNRDHNNRLEKSYSHSLVAEE